MLRLSEILRNLELERAMGDHPMRDPHPNDRPPRVGHCDCLDCDPCICPECNIVDESPYDDDSETG